jgi:hypothetical protein
MAGRRLWSRRCYCFGLDGNLQLCGEPLWVAFAYTDGNRNGNCHSNGNVDAIWDTISYSKCHWYADGITNSDPV